ncbi:restriction endonuclease subunit S [Yersinia enterocolitica]|uniref:restriction endonuclease subunit S n=1 Tax=Yersinia enterocolitica TaxID=630 RepID=UPI0021E822BF|nr:restriction endonuclease subunit S [Yersinia enterocolitica]EKN3500339.1 restriction endonuclease subunit S [Yersinia enterocolitica]EKN4006095.1 restriction endonuclease subunit S [Yersinia enterocolitica]EKN4026676.1 restriction endonuclease subunit S [Yersinia enterocolitica]EKN4060038.1 restriction endonuclease subunit S [Yersinia enterocolitica]EKN5143454.1 restriction endonuclease subunit S [Yersinia enterocolitica]
MSIDSRVPEIRFKGFSEEWENLTLGDLGSVAMNKRIFKHQTTITGDVPFFKIGTFGKQPDAFINKALFDEYKAKYPYPVAGDLLLSASGSIGRVVEYKGEDQYFQDSNIVWLKHDGKIDNAFLKVFYSMVKWGGLEGSTIKRLYNKNILDTEISTPERQEQNVIGNYFQKLDSLINQHQQKHDKLSNIKKAILEKMFPKQGETIPEIRFKGFSGGWEEKNVDQLGEIITGSTPSTQNSNNYSNDGIPWVTPTDISRNVTFNTAKKLSQTGCKVARIVPKDTILVTCIASIGKNTILGTQGSFNQQINGVVPNEKENDPYFLFSASILWSEKLKRSAASGTMQIVNKTEFSELKTRVPKKEEQTAIGNYFQKLDALINQHQQQIAKLNNIKQACLSKMFV